MNSKRSTRQCAHIWSDNLQLPIQRILHILNGFYTCSQSKISLLSPRMIGLKLAFTYMARGDFSCFLRSNSIQRSIFGVNYSRDPTTRDAEFGCGFGFQKQMVRKYQARLCWILLRVKTYNLLMQHYLSIRAKPTSDIIVNVFGNIINLSGKNYIVFGTH